MEYNNVLKLYLCEIKLPIVIVIYALISISLLVAVIFLILFLISVNKGQYEDLQTPAIRILFEDELIDRSKSKNNNDKHSKVLLR